MSLATEPLYSPASLPLGHELLRLSRRDVAHWSAACAVVLMAFTAGTCALLFWQSDDEMPGSPPPSIVVDFAPRLMAPPQTQDLAPGPQMVEHALSTPTKEADSPTRDRPEDKPQPEKPVEKAVKDPSPTAEVAPDVVKTKDLTPPTKARVVDPDARVAVQETVPDLLPAVNPDVALPIAAASPPPAAAPARAVSVTAQPPSTPAPVTTALPPAELASIAGAPKVVYARKADEITPAKWHLRVVAYLERFKTYPAEAKERGERGIVTVRFSIDRDGRVLSSGIVQSSGSALLDQAVLAMVHRAASVPPPPASLPDSDLELTAPVRFNLR